VSKSKKSILVLKEDRILGSVDGIDRLIASLANSDQEYKWYYFTNNLGNKSYLFDSSVEVIEQIFPGYGWRQLVRQFSGLIKARRKIKDIDPDIVIETQAYHRLLTICSRHKKVINYHHSAFPRRKIKWTRPLESLYSLLFGENFTGRPVITVCTSARRAIIDLGIDESKIFLLKNPYPILSEKTVTGALGSKKIEIIGVGRINERKGGLDFAKIAKKLHCDELNFTFLGVAKDANGEHIKEKYAGYVNFKGHVDKPDRFYANADVGMFLSHEESGSLIIREMMAFKLPVVHWNLPNISEDLDSQKCLGADYKNYEHLIKIIDKLIKDINLRVSIGNENYIIASSYTAKHHQTKFKAILNSIKDD
jgi:glycosyltransferase involved in cell wall biosynthesis